MSSLQRGSDYPFLRMTRWIVRALAIGYGVLGAVLAVILVAGSVSKELREAVVWLGGPAEGHGALAAALLLVTVAVRSILLLAVSEGLQLLLDLRSTQLDMAMAQGELHEDVSRLARGTPSVTPRA